MNAGFIYFLELVTLFWEKLLAQGFYDRKLQDLVTGWPVIRGCL